MNEIHFDFLNFNNILLLLVILAIGGYLYYEIHKMKLSMNDIHSKLNYLLDKREIISNDNIQSPQPNEQIMPNGVVIPDGVIPNEAVMSNEVIESNKTSISSQNIKQQMDKDSEYSDSESSDDSRSESSDDSRSESSDTESRISQSEIEKDYGKN